MTLTRSLIVSAIAVGCCAAASADILTTTGSTAGGPTFNRAVEDFSALSGVATDVSYSSFVFTVDTDGDYTFLTTATFDSFVFLYSPSFSAAAPLSNGVAANDDLVSTTTSGLAWELDAGVTYTYVVTGFENADAGAFSTTIGGPGVITVVPEPAAAAMLFAGLGVLAFVARRRAAGRDREPA